MTTLGIDAVGEVCERQYAVSLGWFVLLGRWIVDEPDPELQRLWSTAAHRHAWHAELWAQRRPRIPPESVPDMPTAAEPATIDDRVGSYREALVAMRTELVDLAAQVDPDLDPSTLRVISLVTADLADLVTGNGTGSMAR